jgi:hypothetical protein
VRFRRGTSVLSAAHRELLQEVDAVTERLTESVTTVRFRVLGPLSHMIASRILACLLSLRLA